MLKSQFSLVKGAGCKESSEKVLCYNRCVTNNPGLPEYEREVAMRKRAVRYNAKLLIHCTCMYTDLRNSLTEKYGIAETADPTTTRRTYTMKHDFQTRLTK